MGVQKSVAADNRATKKDDMRKAYDLVMKTVKTDESTGRRFGALACLMDMYDDKDWESKRHEIMEAIADCALHDTDPKTSAFAMRFIGEL